MSDLRKVAVVFIAFASSWVLPALAADMALGPVPSPGWSWTGCYVGANGAYSWARGSTSYINDPNPTPDPVNGLTTPTPAIPNSFVPPPSNINISGGLGGGGGGCNVQVNQLVFGFEADFDGGQVSGRQTTNGINPPAQIGGTPAYQLGPLFQPPSGGVGIGNLNGTGNEQVNLQWLSTVRARAGVAFQGGLLLFGSAGLALGEIKNQGSVAVAGSVAGPVAIWSGNDSRVSAGYAVGGGAEWAIYNHWTVKAEYLWYYLGSGTVHPLNCSFGCAPNVYSTLGSASTTARGNLVRLGLNFNFGGLR